MHVITVVLCAVGLVTLVLLALYAASELHETGKTARRKKEKRLEEIRWNIAQIRKDLDAISGMTDEPEEISKTIRTIRRRKNQ